MKSKKAVVLCLLGLSAIGWSAPSARAQGSLTPSGAPGATMVTLSQIEPRTPISGAFNISAPGSYYLTTNITVSFIIPVVISINSSQVTLDLNGFTIASTAIGSAEAGAGAIELASGLSDITILNGHIQGGVTYNGSTYHAFGFGDGINYTGTAPLNARVSGVSVTGCEYYGINLGATNGSVVEGCTVRTVGGYGIMACCVFRSTSYQCGNSAIAASIASDCYGFSTGSYGVLTSYTANNCYGVSSYFEGTGLRTTSANNCYGQVTGWGGYEGNPGLLANTATGCTGQNITSVGLSASVALNCYGYSAGAGGAQDNLSITGIATSTAENCYGISSTGYGINSTIAIGSVATSTSDGVGTASYGLVSTIANSCSSSGGNGGVTYKYNMP
jgi:hypothetical protein